MLQRDQVFLNDYIQFGFMNHIVAAQVLYSAGASPDATATALRGAVENLQPEQAKALASELNDGPRMQRIVVGRLYAELASTVEDLGALGFAIRHRAKDGLGILKRYLRSMTSDVGTFYADVLGATGADLGALLRLPDLAALETQVTPEAHKRVVFDYGQLAEALRQAAATYRAAIPAAGTPVRTPLTLPAAWEDSTNILLEIADQGDSPKPSASGAMPMTFNKLKHRFMVVEALDRFAAISDVAQELTVVHYPLNADSVAKLLTQVVQATMCSVEIASLVFSLANDGVSL